MFAVVEISGQQFKVQKDQKLLVNRLDEKEGSKISFENVLLVDNGDELTLGTPKIDGYQVEAKVIKHLRGQKVVVFKKKRRKGYRVKNGHKQHLSEILIESISKSNNLVKKDKTSNLRVFGNTSIPGIDATTGSLGHGLGIACGMAYLYKKQEIDKKVYVVISEGELYEGSTWEALLFAAHNKLENLNIIIDENSLIILGTTDDCLRLDPIKKKIEGFGFNVDHIDGHNLEQIEKALNNKIKGVKVILAKTVKGKGFSIMENKANWHYWNPIDEKEIEICRKDIE